MRTILFVADRTSVINRVVAALSEPDTNLIVHSDPNTAAAAAYEHDADRVLVDMTVGSMGAMAVARSVRSMGKDHPIPVTILLDRAADAFLAGRSGADSWLSKDVPDSELRAVVIGSRAAT